SVRSGATGPRAPAGRASAVLMQSRRERNELDRLSLPEARLVEGVRHGGRVGGVSTFLCLSPPGPPGGNAVGSPSFRPRGRSGRRKPPGGKGRQFRRLLPL